MAKKKTGFSLLKRTTKKEPWSFKIDAKLKNGYDEFQKRLEKIDPDLKLDAVEIVESALRNALEQATKELDEQEKELLKGSGNKQTNEMVKKKEEETEIA